jgi:hypothetical protein
MKNLIQAAVVTLFAASTAQAQQAVQWKVSDGGNGHWYSVSSFVGTWPDVQDWCGARGSHLATLTSAAEWLWVKASLPVAERFVGGYQDRSNSDYQEPSGGWRWVTGEEFLLTTYMTLDDCPGGSTGSCGCGTPGAQDVLFFTGCCNNVLDDVGDGIVANCDSQGRSGIVEWSADCNGDGIVDYGQCRDGTLPDYNGNNIPDCCEDGRPCVVGNYPVQWRVEDGGNGHWYQFVQEIHSFSWHQMSASARNASVVSIANSVENNFVYNLVRAAPNAPFDRCVWIGLVQDPPGAEPDQGWNWIDGLNSTWRNWATAEPDNNWPYEEDNCRMIVSMESSPLQGMWQDYADASSFSSVIEWSADCNNDGIVDYGQIMNGQLGDLNSDGIPDICQQPTCADADLFANGLINGADLGILLSEWGPASPSTVSDITRDGVVDGADLGVLLSFWGACP